MYKADLCKMQGDTTLLFQAYVYTRLSSLTLQADHSTAQQGVTEPHHKQQSLTPKQSCEQHQEYCPGPAFQSQRLLGGALP